MKTVIALDEKAEHLAELMSRYQPVSITWRAVLILQSPTQPEKWCKLA